MKGIIIAGGKGTRLYPLTNPLNKHLLPIYDRPMIMHVISALVGGGVTDILLSLNEKNPGLFLEMLKDGSDLGAHLMYVYEREIMGSGGTLLLAERWIGKEDFVAILGDSLYLTPLSFTGKKAPHLFAMPLNGHDDHEKYGQIKIKNGRVTKLVDKSMEYFSEIIQTACFIFPPDVFGLIRRLMKEKGNQEITISEISHYFIKEGRMRYTMIPEGSYIDCGTKDALLKANKIMAERAAAFPR